MSIDSMRFNGGRCPPLFVFGLIVACIIMLCNWLNLYSANLELLRQIDELNEQIKISVEERDQCVTQRDTQEHKNKLLDKDIATLHVQLTKIKEEKEEQVSDLIVCRGELESLKKVDDSKSGTLETLRLDVSKKKKQIEDLEIKNEEMEKELAKKNNELQNIKLSFNSPSKKISMDPITNRVIKNNAHLGSIGDSAVEIISQGQKGLLFHGIPVLPQDPPGVTRLKPRLSVTKIGNNNIHDDDVKKLIKLQPGNMTSNSSQPIMQNLIDNDIKDAEPNNKGSVIDKEENNAAEVES